MTDELFNNYKIHLLTITNA